MTPAQLAEHEELAAWACLPLGEEQSEALLSSARALALEVRRLLEVVAKRPRVEYVYVPVSCGCPGCDGGRP